MAERNLYLKPHTSGVDVIDLSYLAFESSVVFYPKAKDVVLWKRHLLKYVGIVYECCRVFLVDAKQRWLHGAFPGLA